MRRNELEKKASERGGRRRAGKTQEKEKERIRRKIYKEDGC